MVEQVEDVHFAILLDRPREVLFECKLVQMVIFEADLGGLLGFLGPEEWD